MDFPALVAAGGTIVVLMGVAALPSITVGLLSPGRHPTPAAVIENGCTPRSGCHGRGGGDRRPRAARGVPPAVIVIGAVAALAESGSPRSG